MKHLKRLLLAVLTFAMIAATFQTQPSQVQAATAKQTIVLQGSAAGSNAMKLKWKKVSGATRYVITSAPCGTTKFKKIKTLKKNKTSCVINGIDPKKPVKFVVSAQKKVGGKYKTIAKSLTAHIVPNGNTAYTNPKAVTLDKSKITLQKGKSKTIKATVKKEFNSKSLLSRKHDQKVRYFSSAPSVAKVSRKGRITAKKAGKCKIYAAAINGIYAVCRVTVKEPAAPAKPVASHKLTYEYTGTVPDGAPAVPAAATYKTGDKVTKAAVPTLTGYEFSGWKGEVSTMPDKDVTVTGSWSKKKMKITYYMPNPTLLENYDEGEESVNFYFDALQDEITPEQVFLSQQDMKALILRIEKIIEDGETHKKEHADSWTQKNEEMLADFKELKKGLEKQKQLLSKPYFTYTDTVTYGDNYTVKAAEKIDAFKNISRIIYDDIFEWTDDTDKNRQDPYNGVFVYSYRNNERPPYTAGKELTNVTEDYDLYAAVYVELTPA